MSEDANLDGGGNTTTQQTDGTPEAPKWTAQLEGDLQKNERLTQFENISEMGKALINTEGKLENALFMPGEEATDEQKAEFYQKLGRPETAEAYQFEKPDGLPEGVFDENQEKMFKELAFEHGLTDAQAKNLNGWYWNMVKQGFDQQKKATDDAINELKNQWGTDGFKENSKIASRAFDDLTKDIPDEEVNGFLESVVGGVEVRNHPVFAKVFLEIAKTVMPDRMGDYRSHGNDGELSDEEQAQRRFPNTYKK